MADIIRHTDDKFNKAYRTLFHFLWTEKRIPKQLKILTNTIKPANSLELGCGLGYFSEYMENQGIKATGIDFSSVAIERAKKRTSKKECKPTYIVGDVTNLNLNDNQYDVIFDIGCLHCLNEDDSNKYAINVHRVLKQNGTLLIWSLRKSFTDIYMTPEFIEKIFEGKLTLEKTEFSRRRIIASNWFWLKKK